MRLIQSEGASMIFMFGPIGLLVLALVTGLGYVAVRATLGLHTPTIAAEATFAAYVAVVVAIVLVEGSHVGIPGERYAVAQSLNLIPLRTIAGYATPRLAGQAFRQVAGNVLLFVPLGMLLPVISGRHRAASSLAWTALLVSVGIELTQLALLVGKVAVRSVDVDDVILNTLGALVGFALWSVFARFRTPAVEVD